jgi:hypothetical protein
MDSPNIFSLEGSQLKKRNSFFGKSWHSFTGMRLQPSFCTPQSLRTTKDTCTKETHAQSPPCCLEWHPGMDGLTLERTRKDPHETREAPGMSPRPVLMVDLNLVKKMKQCVCVCVCVCVCLLAYLLSVPTFLQFIILPGRLSFLGRVPRATCHIQRFWLQRRPGAAQARYCPGLTCKLVLGVLWGQLKSACHPSWPLSSNPLLSWNLW